ncbi:RAB11-binding protein RELCH homolog [Brienomyrus brachyistius]|uniref:RAB11-binding protein RELCH homolog n=1 Tax=Brienomyrus brachyistius TaxID=42636 RepID=UPI0020B32401|nr:RAB11-binding protein RELCH homolog [Brienomyrus brachyistius]
MKEHNHRPAAERKEKRKDLPHITYKNYSRFAHPTHAGIRCRTKLKVKPQFQEILRLSEESVDATDGNDVLTKGTVPIYATGVLTCYNQEEDRKLLVAFLEDVMMSLSLSHAPLDSLKAAFMELGANPAYHELLLTVLWYGVVHTSALVRCTAARMFEVSGRMLRDEASGVAVTVVRIMRVGV